MANDLTPTGRSLLNLPAPMADEQKPVEVENFADEQSLRGLLHQGLADIPAALRIPVQGVGVEMKRPISVAQLADWLEHRACDEGATAAFCEMAAASLRSLASPSPERDYDDWLIQQLEEWPTRVDPDKTTNIEILMKAAAKRLRASPEREALERAAKVAESKADFCQAGEWGAPFSAGIRHRSIEIAKAIRALIPPLPEQPDQGER